MKNQKIRPLLLLSTMAFCFRLCADTTNTVAESPNALAKQVQKAIAMKDINSLLDLYYWNNIDDDVKTQIKAAMTFIVQKDVSDVSTLPKPSEFQSVYVMHGVTYQFNIPISGLIKVKFSGDANFVQIPYGQYDGRLFLATQVKSKSESANVKDKFLTIEAFGVDTTSGLSPSVECNYTYVSNGKEIKEKLSGTASVSKSFWGDAVRFCEAKSSSTNTLITLIVMEDSKTIFKADVENTNRVTYDAK